MRLSILLAWCCAGSTALAQETQVTQGPQDIGLERRPARWRIGVESVDAPGAGKIGLVGVHYDVLAPWREFTPLYFGVGGYTAVTGDHGGFLLGGLTIGTLFRIGAGWYLDLGAFAGGGGGGGVATDSGLALRPFIALERPIGTLALRAEVALLDLGDFDHDPYLSLGISLPAEILQARPARLGQAIPAEARDERVVRFAPRVLWIDPQDSRRTDGSALDDPITCLGAGADLYVSSALFIPFEAYGAVGGDVAGFAAALTGLGASFPLVGPFSAEGKLEVGAGGGGDVDTGGGFLWQASGGLRAQLFSHASLELSAGRLEAPDGGFGGTTVQLGIAWSVQPVELAYDYPRGNLAREGLSSEDVGLSTTRFEALGKFYLPKEDAHKESGAELDHTLSLVGVGAEQSVTDWLAFAARAFAAVDGDIGGYAEGWLGARLETHPPYMAGHVFYVGADVGAGGGGDMDVGSGLLGDLCAGWRGDLGPRAFLSIELARTMSAHGSFDAGTAVVGLGWSLTRAIAR